MIFSSHDTAYMARALALGKRGAPFVSPNPMVGAVIVKGGKVIGQGWHKKFGGPHAEVAALKNARAHGHNVRGATLYVTLEPCVHENKKTPPCVPQIISSGVSRVVAAMKDPNPRVRGRGLKAFQKAKLKVAVGCLAAEAACLNEKFIKWKTRGVPFVAMKVAMSLDGKIATKNGDSKWITGPSSRNFVHGPLRDAFDAVLVGSHTVLYDDPHLAGTKHQPRRIILDSLLRTPLNYRVLRDKNVLIVTTRRASAARRAAFEKKKIPLKIFHQKIKLAPLLRYLAQENISSVLVEGGAEIFGSFIDEKLVDQFFWFIAPKIIGGRSAKTAVAGSGAASMKKIIELSDISLESIGEDFLFVARPKRR